MAARDAAFEKRALVLEEVGAVKALADRDAPALLRDAEAVGRDYLKRFEEHALARAQAVLKEAEGLAAARKYREAVAAIDALPYRSSEAWRGLTERRAEYDRLASAPARPWDELFAEARTAYLSKDYAKAKELYLTAAPLAPVKVPSDKNHSNWQYGHFNIACMLADDAREAQGDARAKLLDQVFTHLQRLFEYRNSKGERCKCQLSCRDQILKNSAWNFVKGDPRYSKLGLEK
jgi:hypothetical protein